MISERTRTHGRVGTPSRTASKSVAPDSCVVVTCGVGSQCKPCICCVAEAGGVVQERRSTCGGISVCGIEHERSGTNAGVEATCGGACERKPTNCCVECAAGETKKRVQAFCGVAIGIVAVRRRTNRLYFGGEANKDCQRDNKYLV